jgi:hypothetical protein
MGTRGLTCVYVNNNFKLAQYGQWDHYPEGNGLIVLSFIKKYLNSAEKISNFMKHINDTYQPTQKEIDKWYHEAGADNKYVSFEISNKLKLAHPSIHRDTGSRILEYIFLNNHVPIISNITFAADSLFCEWVYVINMDTQELEIYKGNNKTPLLPTERFYFLTDKSDKIYYPVKKVAALSFNLCYNLTDKNFVSLLEVTNSEHK